MISKNDRRHRWLILGTVMIGTFMGALDASIVNVSIPVMMRFFSVSVGDIGWVITAYMISFAVCMPLTSWLRDHHGGKRLYIAALAVFTIGSLLCGAAPSLPFLILARVIQAVGAGALTPAAMSLVAEVFEPKERGRAFGYWGVGVIVGPALGPTLGGVLTEMFSWRAIFLVNLPVGIFGLWLAMRVLPKHEPPAATPSKLDIKGFVLLAIFLVLFLFGVTNFENAGPSGRVPTWVWPCLVVSWLFLAAFIQFERKAQHPLIELNLFRNRTFSASILLTLCRSAALFGGIFMLPILLQDVLHYGETQAGLIMLPGAVLIGILMPLSGKWADRNGARVLVVSGVLLVSISMLWLSLFRTDHALFDVSCALLLRGFGLGLLVTPVSAVTMNSVPHHRVAMASSLSSLFQQVGGAIGIAGTASFYQIWLGWRMRSMPLGASSPELDSLRATFMFGASLMILGVIPSLFLPRRSAHVAEAGQLAPLD